MAKRRPKRPNLGPILSRLDAPEQEVQRLRREAAADQAALSEWIELALSPSLHTSTLDLIDDARAAGWRVIFGRRRQRDAKGTIYFEHPSDSVHNCKPDFPLPAEDLRRRQMEHHVRLRFALADAA